MGLAAIYDPYLDTIGGGERYTLTFAVILKEMGYEVDIFWDDPAIAQLLQKRFGLDLSSLNFLPNIFTNRNFLGTGSYLRSYDVVFMLSDGSIPFMTGKKNILHFQVPFKNVGGRKTLNRLKLKTIHHIVCNSRFTKKYIDQEYGVNSIVVYPPIAVDSLTSQKKEKIILSVGRFSQLLQSKRQDILINSFKKLYQQNTNGWKFVLAGGSDIGGSAQVEKLKKETTGYPIEIIENPTFSQLQGLYGRASIFWYAAGFGIDEEKFPQKVEHLGITTLESMSAGCVPIIHPKGGVLEVITDRKDGFFWETPEQLLEITKKVISKPVLLSSISNNAVSRSKHFSQEVFKQEFIKLIK